MQMFAIQLQEFVSVKTACAVRTGELMPRMCSLFFWRESKFIDELCSTYTNPFFSTIL